MSISTNSIIHYTNTLDKLKSIIKEGFRIKYCVEKLLSKKRSYGNAHPMISFCDIPLSDSVRHFDLYGNYGIGISKEWAKKYGINPVLYIDTDSRIGDALDNMQEKFEKAKDVIPPEAFNVILMTKCFSKNYKGPLKRGKINIPDYKFYDEREWRFVPTREDIQNEKISIMADVYEKDKDLYNNKLANYRYTFNHDDISYLIVKSTDEIPDMIEFLRNTFYKTLKISELDILLSKVCSTEQIIEDY
ncbi:MAG TPA: abortive infection system antitoxin AbiGi family protein [Ferruginibacter sp.]|nr:abortive infection system antitoxin AbiGi family protein [Ferruginibacter sp.]